MKPHGEYLRIENRYCALFLTPQTILVLVLLILTVGGGRCIDDEQPHTLCGRRLANVRMFYCSNTKDAPHKRDIEVIGMLG